MPDREKVIKAFEECICKSHKYCTECYQGYHGLGMICRNSVCFDALALLKEQETKQVIRKQCKKEHDDGSIDYFAEWYCPHCNSLILRGFDNPSIKFCYKCGKPVLWKGR